jgi:hypothetical protein
MPGISSVRPQYNSLGIVATRLAGGARRVAHESSKGDIAVLVEARASGGQDDTVPQEVVAQPFDKPRDGESGRKQAREQALSAPAAAAEPAAEFRLDGPPRSARAVPFGLVVAAPLAMPELLRAAEQAYGYSRGALPKPGDQLDAAS